ncbi:MAG: nitroreductase [candidate division NC10 bacterium]|nr:nitroreductase [candidate division NC10 bacterium]
MGPLLKHHGDRSEPRLAGTRSRLRCPLLPFVAILALFTAESCMADQGIDSLPEPAIASDRCLNAILQNRRTTRAFSPQPVSLAEVAQLLWAAQGITSPEGYRTAPSAGALYPLELHLVAGDVEGLPAGHYRYQPRLHALKAADLGDNRQLIAKAALHQDWIAQAPVVVVVSAIASRTTGKYGQRGLRYVHMEVGHASQNLLLQAVALGLGGAVVGAFDDTALKDLLRLPGDEHPLAILPVGHPR